jgi:hypothetical protein
MSEKFKKLRFLNLWAALLHFVSGLVMLLVSSGLTVPVNGSFLRFDVATGSLYPKMTTLFDIKLAPLVASFLFMSALAHLLISLPKINDWYNRNLGKGINYARWVEYSFSSSVMIIIIAMLVGIYDIGALIPIFFVNASMILFGWMMEKHNQALRQAGQTKADWTSFIFGCIAGIGPWIAVAIYLANPGSTDHPPTFVYWIFFSIFIFFNIFAINQVLQYKKIGKWSDYLYGEKVYIILSFVAKSLLAWQVFAGTLRP